MHQERYIDSYKEHIEIIDMMLSGDEDKVMECSKEAYIEYRRRI